MRRYYGIPAGYEDDEDELDSIERTARNLKISVVPDISAGAGLNGKDFDSRLSADIDNWLETYRELWNAYKRTPAVQQRLKTVFLNDTDPLMLALKIFANCPGCNNLKNKSLALFILESICDLYKQDPSIAANCDDNTRMVAFNFVKTCGVNSLYKAVLQTYELHKIRELLVPKLKALVSQGHIKDAAYWAMYLQVTDLFDVFEIVFPLLLQDKVFLVEEYLTVAKEQQLPVVQFLDSLLNKQKTVFEHCDAILFKYKYKDVRHDVLSYRPMSKLVTRLAKKYKIDANLTPNLTYTKACSYLHYLYRKYQDDGMSTDSWRELVCDAAVTKDLQVDLVTNIASYGDVPEASYWAKHFKVPLADCPSSVQLCLKENTSNADESTKVGGPSSDNIVDTATQFGAVMKPKKANNIVASSEEFLTLQLPADCVILVDDKTKFLDMLVYLEAQTLIAFDSEWKPSVRSDNVVSLLQLATYERVYLLDCLSTQLGSDLWQLLGQRVFNNLEILKVGFSLHQDLRMLQRSLPLHLNLQATVGYLDLREMWRRLKYMQIMAFSCQAGESLCDLTELCLGKKLDKSNQFSNWANRPLRHNQIIYAALDAHCLLQIYQVISELLQRMGLEVEKVVDDITTAQTGYLYSMKRVTTNTDNIDDAGPVFGTALRAPTTSGCGDTNVVRATEVKFICDSMLLGLSRELRKLGIDSIDIKSPDINYYINLAKDEQRYVLTRDARYNLFTAEMPQTQCLQIPMDSSVEQALNVLQYLRIRVQEENLYTRCLQCNGNEFILALQDEIRSMRLGRLLQDECGASESNATTRSGVNPNERTCNLLNVNEHIMNTKTTYQGRPIKLHRIKPHILRTREHFFICDNCGACTWDGAHSLASSIMDIINTNSHLSDARDSVPTTTK